MPYFNLSVKPTLRKIITEHAHSPSLDGIDTFKEVFIKNILNSKLQVILMPGNASENFMFTSLCQIIPQKNQIKLQVLENFQANYDEAILSFMPKQLEAMLNDLYRPRSEQTVPNYNWRGGFVHALAELTYYYPRLSSDQQNILVHAIFRIAKSGLSESRVRDKVNSLHTSINAAHSLQNKESDEEVESKSSYNKRKSEISHDEDVLAKKGKAEKSFTLTEQPSSKKQASYQNNYLAFFAFPGERSQLFGLGDGNNESPEYCSSSKCLKDFFK